MKGRLLNYNTYDIKFKFYYIQIQRHVVKIEIKKTSKQIFAKASDLQNLPLS